LAKRIRLDATFPFFHFNVLGSDSGAPTNFISSALDGTYGTIFGGDVTELSNQLTEQLVRQGYVTNPHVYSVVNNLLTSALQIPWQVYEIKDPKVFKRYKSFKESGQLDKALEIEFKAVDIFQGENQLTKLLEKPNEFQTFEELINTLLGMRYLTGNSYMYGVGTGLKSMPLITELIPLPSQYMKVKPTDKWFGEVDKYQLHLGNETGVEFKSDEIMHIKMFNPLLNDTNNIYTLGLYGQSPLTPLCKVIQQSNDGFTAQMKILKHGHPLGILSNGSNEPMLANDADDLEKRMSANYGGSSNKGKIRMTTANLKWVQMGFNSVDMQLSEQQKFTLETVCAAYGLPAPNVTGTNANFNTSKEAEKQKWNDAILPHLSVIQSHLNRFLHKAMPNLPKTTFIDYDHRSVPSLQQDLDRITKIVLSQMDRGLLNGNDANRMLLNDVTPAEHHNKYFIATNLRWTDEALPGQTGMNTNNNDNA